MQNFGLWVLGTPQKKKKTYIFGFCGLFSLYKVWTIRLLDYFVQFRKN